MTASTEGERAWGVRPLVPVVSGLCGVALASWLLVADAPEDVVVAATGVVVAAITTILLARMRIRLTAGPDGFGVRGFTGSRRFRWTSVTGIAAPTRRRGGVASTSLELDLDDDSLIVLSRTELGAAPAEVAAELRRWWRPARAAADAAGANRPAG